ncbi:DUF6090 family protein [Winogradskyella aurantia]|uniref:Uncharacterized protein n=1 Tax=Winogradskyella aurantia TaxID=1915063 RepID=A0A265UZQ1_9FLAO|nr:DUF6090 family protein [Winogradskyella aurantia]OZV70547.1 hypothetical protein CA834_00060 [Winogradskyella aurantia]
MKKNKTGKYLKYALGEIVLVMIGILLALQINNWNNDRIERKLESNILNEILVNLKKDVINLNSKIKFNQEKFKLNRDVLIHLEQKTPLTDSLRFSYNKLIGRGTFEPITVAYENLKSKGIDIINNDSLRIAISELYDFKYFYITEDLRADYEPVKTLHMSEVFKNVRTSFGQSKSEPANLKEAQDNTYFHEALKQALGYYFWINTNYERGIKENEEVQRKIEAELMQRNK